MCDRDEIIKAIGSDGQLATAAFSNIYILIPVVILLIYAFIGMNSQLDGGLLLNAWKGSTAAFRSVKRTNRKLMNKMDGDRKDEFSTVVKILVLVGFAASTAAVLYVVMEDPVFTPLMLALVLSLIILPYTFIGKLQLVASALSGILMGLVLGFVIYIFRFFSFSKDNLIGDLVYFISGAIFFLFVLAIIGNTVEGNELRSEKAPDYVEPTVDYPQEF